MSVSVQSEKFDLQSEIDDICRDRTDIGAVVSFTGLVRDVSKGKEINLMTLEHYPGMAENELSKLEYDANERWPLQASRIIHRYGDLAPGDLIVLVITASAHREAAFEAAHFMMDYLKTSAPFWKKERFKDGSGSVWVESKTDDEVSKSKWEK